MGISREVIEGKIIPKVCINCRFCNGVSSARGERYLCHYFPPLSITTNQNGELMTSRFPKVRDDWFCSKWEMLTELQISFRGINYDIEIPASQSFI